MSNWNLQKYKVLTALFFKKLHFFKFVVQKIFGAHGDFVTSPEISQLFGEMIGIWIALELENTGHKGEWQLVELGPGSGLLMRDILTVFKNLKVLCSNI